MYKLSGQLAQENARQAVDAGIAALTAGASDFDLSGLERVDSAAVAVMIAWQRYALQEKKLLKFHSAPPALQSLIALYGLSGQFQMVAAERH